MNPDEMRDLAALLQTLPGIKSLELRDVKRLVQLLRDSPEIGSIEVKGWFGTGVVVTRTNNGLGGGPYPLAAPPPAYASLPPAEAPRAPPAVSAPAPALKEI